MEAQVIVIMKIMQSETKDDILKKEHLLYTE